MMSCEIVLAIRKATGLTQQKFANLAELHRSSVSQFETGTRTPRPFHAHKYLAVANTYNLNYKLEDFYGCAKTASEIHTHINNRYKMGVK